MYWCLTSYKYSKYKFGGWVKMCTAAAHRMDRVGTRDLWQGVMDRGVYQNGYFAKITGTN